MKLLIESKVKITEGLGRIEGIAAIPRVSRNGRVYPPEELAKLDGATVPIIWAHSGTPESVNDAIPSNKIIGTMTLTWDKTLEQLKYTGTVADAYIPIIKTTEGLGVSIGAHSRVSRVCTMRACYDMVRDIRIEEASLTPAPGMPETTVKLIESIDFSCDCLKHKIREDDAKVQACVARKIEQHGGEPTEQELAIKYSECREEVYGKTKEMVGGPEEEYKYLDE